MTDDKGEGMHIIAVPFENFPEDPYKLFIVTETTFGGDLDGITSLL